MQLPCRRCIPATHGDAHDGVHRDFAPEVPATSFLLQAREDVDARDIGVRKHAVLWTAMRGHDAKYEARPYTPQNKNPGGFPPGALLTQP